MQRKKPRKFRLLVTISVLFTVLIIFYGLFFRQFIFWQTSNLLLDGSDRYFAQVSRELILEYQKEKWLGAARKLNLSGLENIHLVMLSPEQELLSEARVIQNPLSEAINIMKKMAEENHIDRELFQLFLQSGAYLEYGRSYLQPEQIDEVKDQQLLKTKQP